MNPVRSAAFRYGRRNRRRKAGFARRFIDQHGVRRVLIVGATPLRDGVNGLVERELLSSADEVVVSGLVEGDGAWEGYVQADGLDLPFETGGFDLVYSNAVIEHVGDIDDQRQFLREHDRVGKQWIATTPNRWFPIEAHRHQLFRHWSPTWSDPRGSVTRLLSPRTLAELLPRGVVLGPAFAPTLTAVSTPSPGSWVRRRRRTGHLGRC